MQSCYFASENSTLTILQWDVVAKDARVSGSKTKNGQIFGFFQLFSIRSNKIHENILFRAT